jgi:hypothetical protein
MIQREISRALVLNLSGKAVLGTAQDIFVLDSAFALIEAHPQLFHFNVSKASVIRPASIGPTRPLGDCLTRSGRQSRLDG